MKTHTRWIKYLLAVVPLALTQTACTKVLAFSTATKVGLDITQRADQTLDVTFGYDRAEIASIPVPKKADASKGDKSNPHHEDECNTTDCDSYSVLGTFHIKYGNPWLFEPVIINQVFATGIAAKDAADNTNFGEYIGKTAAKIAEDAQNK